MTKEYSDREIIEWLDGSVCFCRAKNVPRSDTYITCDRCKKKTPRLHWTCDASGDEKVYYNHMAGTTLTLEFMLGKVVEKLGAVNFSYKKKQTHKGRILKYAPNEVGEIVCEGENPTLALRGAICKLIEGEEG